MLEFVVAELVSSSKMFNMDTFLVTFDFPVYVHFWQTRTFCKAVFNCVNFQINCGWGITEEQQFISSGSCTDGSPLQTEFQKCLPCLWQTAAAGYYKFFRLIVLVRTCRQHSITIRRQSYLAIPRQTADRTIHKLLDWNMILCLRTCGVLLQLCLAAKLTMLFYLHAEGD